MVSTTNNEKLHAEIGKLSWSSYSVTSLFQEAEEESERYYCQRQLFGGREEKYSDEVLVDPHKKCEFSVEGW